MEHQTASNETTVHKDVYALVTDRIIDQLNKGTVPWRMPWSGLGIPKNLISQRPYRGINLMLLASLGYEQNLFLTYKQLQEAGGRVIRGEKAHVVVYWNFHEEKDETKVENARKKVPYLRYYLVFNVAQCESIPQHLIPVAFTENIEPIVRCERIIEEMPQKPTLQHKEQSAWYNPVTDVVNMPKMKSFKTSDSYYATLFHELVHSTGHISRLNRKDLLQMSELGSDAYSHEELVAEMGTCFLQSVCGITTEFEQSAAYIAGWLVQLSNDKRFIFSAAAQAQKAVDFILNVHPEETTAEEEEI